jgi:hypothetical protein
MYLYSLQIQGDLNKQKIQLATFRHVAYCLNQLRYRIPHAMYGCVLLNGHVTMQPMDIAVIFLL